MVEEAQVLKTVLNLSSPATSQSGGPGQDVVSFSVLISKGEAGPWVGHAHTGEERLNHMVSLCLTNKSLQMVF